MRRPLIAGNWKMNTGSCRRRRLGRRVVAKGSVDFPSVDLVVCPPFVYLEAVRQAIGEAAGGAGRPEHVSPGAGRVHRRNQPAMLLDLGCRYVILGHSERRQLFGKPTPR